MIRRAHARLVGGAAAADVISARGPFAERAGVLLELTDERGIAGFGEASPLPPLSTESLSSVLAALPDVAWAALRVPAEVEQLVADAPRLAHLPPSLRFAVESALASIAASRKTLSLGAWLSRQPLSCVPRSVLVGRLGDSRALASARAAAARGVHSFKLKAQGVDVDGSEPFLRELFASTGRETEVRVDFNGSLAPSDVAEVAGVLAASGVALIEEPCAGEALLELGALALPWYADESLAELELRTRLLARGALSGVVLKPTVLGGLSCAWQLARRASSQSLGLFVTHTFEGAIALAACAELGLALAPGAGARAPGLDAHAALATFGIDPPRQVPALGPAIVPLASGCGLGFDPSPLGALGREVLEWTR